MVSYHLRKLAEHGFVTQASGQGADGRERWWQVASEEGWASTTQNAIGRSHIEDVPRSGTEHAQYFWMGKL